MQNGMFGERMAEIWTRHDCLSDGSQPNKPLSTNTTPWHPRAIVWRGPVVVLAMSFEGNGPWKYVDADLAHLHMVHEYTASKYGESGPPQAD